MNKIVLLLSLRKTTPSNQSSNQYIDNMALHRKKNERSFFKDLNQKKQTYSSKLFPVVSVI